MISVAIVFYLCLLLYCIEKIVIIFVGHLFYFIGFMLFVIVLDLGYLEVSVIVHISVSDCLSSQSIMVNHTLDNIYA